jgi:hypothetical protein
MIRSTSILKRTLVGFICIVMLAFSFFGVTNKASAVTITRYVSTSGTDTGNCSSSGSPCRTIQYAVNQSTAGDTIKVAAGTYTYNAGTDLCTWAITRAVVCFVDKSLTILGGYTTSNWSSADPNANLTVLDGQNTVRGVIAVKYTGAASLVMEGFTIQNGRSQGANTSSDYDARGFGGGLWSQKASLTLRNMIFRNNYAIGSDRAYPFGGDGSGGGVAIEADPGTNLPVTIENVTFQNNQALGGDGTERGGIAHGGGIFAYNASITGANLVFDNNLAQAGNSGGDGIDSILNGRADALGGGIALQIGSSATFSGITLTNNRAIGGNAGSATGNQAGSGLGGAIYSEQAPFQLYDSVLQSNTAQGGVAKLGGIAFGGGININYSTVTVERVRILNNLALSGGSPSGGSAGVVSGGGLYVAAYASPGNGHLTLRNVVVADNGVQVGAPGTSSVSAGAGMAIQASTADIIHATFSNNRFITTGQSGQAISVEGSGGASGVGGVVNISYTIISNHINSATSNTSALTVYGTSSATLNYVLFSGNTNNTNSNNQPAAHGTITQSNTLTPSGSMSFVSPGSPQFNYHIQIDSPAKDKAVGSPTTTDMDAQGRPYNGISDIGADEYWPTVQVLDSNTTGVFRPSNGLLYLKNSNTSGFADVALNYGLPGDYPVVGDWDGNGTVTIGIYRQGYFYLKNANTLGFADIVFPFGNPGDQPIAGDWDGNGVDTIGVFRPSTGQFLLRNSNSEGPAEASFFLGNVGDVGVAGDWDGDGMDTTGVFRPSNGVIFLKNKNDTGFADIALNYGLPGDRPVMGDWNNDGKDTIGIYRNGTFFLRNENTNGFAELIFALGNPGDMPIAGNWDNKP